MPPNVLLIVADDMGWGDLRLHGNERIDTPVLDRFAQESARFEVLLKTCANPLNAVNIIMNSRMAEEWQTDIDELPNSACSRRRRVPS